ncbi:FAD-dependent oxidoreductase [Acuticoccus sediminis]|uniref:FAD-dependent oxidoreductase n=1 Tax=Acuticoccus sediminis TaxID=2184697 RepID=A0A8B2P1E5_9HYPH|nr:FAD-dependent oxidoreductase [Acuticoccus sediminis]RAI02097.1 FAD-dependent oxidoreductase [Acuticoccus sediminis]
MTRPAPGPIKDTPYWWEAAAPIGRDVEPADPPARVDVLVIGAGYTGLSAARVLAGAGRSVAVVDAGPIGIGASTRNGGSAVAGIKKHFLKNADSRSWGDDLLAELRRAFDHFEAMVTENGVGSYSRCGRFVGAHSPRAFRALAEEAEELGQHFDGGVEVIPIERQREELATSYYFGGVLTKQAGGAHPALFHRGLVDACRGRRVTLHPETRVTGWSGRRGAFRVATTRGEVAAAEIVLGTNGYTDAAAPWYRRRIVPIESHMIATEPMGRDVVARLLPPMRVYGDTKRVPYYFRPSPDGTRLLFGGRATFGSPDTATIARTLLSFARGVLPDLPDVAVTHAWRGRVGFTFDFVPHIGVHDGVHYAMGCNGGGLVQLTWLGDRIGQKVLTPDAEVSIFERAPFPTRPGYTGTPWFLPAMGRMYRMRDRIDRLAR